MKNLRFHFLPHYTSTQDAQFIGGIALTPKTEKGAMMIATQRSKPDFEVNNGPMSVTVHPNGDLVLSGLTGDERGLRIKASVSLDEILAWLPEMIAKARNHSEAKAKQELIEALRQEGYIVTTSPRVKISPRSGA